MADNSRITPEPFQGGQIRFVKAGEGNMNGKMTIWDDSVKVRGITREEIKLPIVAVRALVKRALEDDEVRGFLGV